MYLASHSLFLALLFYSGYFAIFILKPILSLLLNDIKIRGLIKIMHFAYLPSRHLYFYLMIFYLHYLTQIRKYLHFHLYRFKSYIHFLFLQQRICAFLLLPPFVFSEKIKRGLRSGMAHIESNKIKWKYTLIVTVSRYDKTVWESRFLMVCTASYLIGTSIRLSQSCFVALPPFQ